LSYVAAKHAALDAGGLPRGVSVVFGSLHPATEDSTTAVTVLGQAAALALVIGVVGIVARRPR
jgi:hypothetical protein